LRNRSDGMNYFIKRDDKEYGPYSLAGSTEGMSLRETCC